MKFDGFIMGIYGYGIFIGLVLLIIMLIATLGLYFYNELTKDKGVNNRSFCVALVVCIFVGIAMTLYYQPEISIHNGNGWLKWLGLYWVLS